MPQTQTPDYLPLATLMAAIAGGLIVLLAALATNRWTAAREDRFRFADAKRDAYQSFLGDAYTFLRAVAPAFWATARDDRFSYEAKADRRIVEQAHGLATRSLTTTELRDSLVLAAVLESEAPRPEDPAPSLVPIVATHTRLAFLAPPETLKESDTVVSVLAQIRQAFDNPNSLMDDARENRLDFLMSKALACLETFRVAARRDAGAPDTELGLLGRARGRLPGRHATRYLGELRPFFDAEPVLPLRCQRCEKPIESVDQGKVWWHSRTADNFQFRFQIVHRVHRETEARTDPWTLRDVDLINICRPGGLENFVYQEIEDKTRPVDDSLLDVVEILAGRPLPYGMAVLLHRSIARRV